MPAPQLFVQFLLQLTVIRGLMELIMLNIVTTLAAGPVFEWAWRGPRQVADLDGVPAH